MHQPTHHKSGATNRTVPKTKGTPRVTIYSTQTCGFCKMEKAWLDEHGIAYTNHFVDEDQLRAHEMIETSGQMGVPVTVVTLPDGSEELVVGFDRPRLAKLIGLGE